MSTLQRLTDRGLVKPPRWLPGNVQYETIMGSVAYGVSSDTSDVDVYGWAIPPKEDIFPHLRGEIPGFGKPGQAVRAVYQEHHVEDRDALAGHGPHLRPDDLRHRQVLPPGDGEQPERHRLAVHARDLRPAQHAGSAISCGRTAGCSSTRGPGPSSKGTPTSQLHKLAIKQPQGKRAELVAEHGFDTQVRLPRRAAHRRGRDDPAGGGHRPPAQQRATQGDPPGRVDRGAAAGLVRREGVAPGAGSTPRARCGRRPDEPKIKALLITALEEHYGSLEGCVVDPDRAVVALRNIQAELERVKDLL